MGIKEGRSSVKDEPFRVDQFRPPLKMMLPLSNLLFSKFHVTVLKEKLKLQKICARWIPHLLTPELKKDRVIVWKMPQFCYLDSRTGTPAA